MKLNTSILDKIAIIFFFTLLVFATFFFGRPEKNIYSIPTNDEAYMMQHKIQ